MMKMRRNLFSLLFTFMLIVSITAGAASVNVYAEDTTGNNSQNNQFDFGNMGNFDFSNMGDFTSIMNNFMNMGNQNQPAPIILLSAKKIKKNSFTLTWNKVNGATKYEVYAGCCGDALRKAESLSPENSLVKIKKVAGKKLRANKCYKFYIVAYGKDSMGNVVRSAVSPIIHLLPKNSNKYGSYKSIKVTSNTMLTLKKDETSIIKVKQVPEKKKKILNHRKVEFLSSDTNVANVEKKSGKITATGKGTCAVYCVSVNGLVAKVSVTVNE